MPELLIEIGTEELPVSYIPPAVQQFSQLVTETLKEADIPFSKVETFATPRRFGLAIADVAEKGLDKTEEVTGPPVKAAFDADGTPKLPAIKFAEKYGLKVEDLQRKQTPKGEYLTAVYHTPGAETEKLLAEKLPQLLRQLHFPKSMRWGTVKTPFARPIHWICAIFGGKILKFQFAEVESSDQSRGHRFLAPEPFKVENYDQFLRELRERYVLAKPKERMELIESESKKLAREAGGELLPDPEMLEFNAYITEYPVPLLATYEEKFLELPRELLYTVMRHHLKCFAVTDSDGNPKPYFIAVSNIKAKDPSKIKNGYVRVLRARLADAEFFYREDLKTGLDSMVPKLDRVIYHSKLGSYGDKVRRLEASIEPLAQLLGLTEVKEKALRAAHLCKADLVSNMVYEFPELQGIMGKYYALAAGEDPEIAEAIREHYLPAGADDDLPETKTGQILAVAERLDTLAGGFAAGLKPTGSADPYGLRRQAIGLLRILLHYRYPAPLDKLLDVALKNLSDKVKAPEKLKGELLSYLRERLLQIWLGRGHHRDYAEAAATDLLISKYPPHLLEKFLSELAEAAKKGVLQKLAFSFKRVNNILKAAVKKKELKGYFGLGRPAEELPPIDEKLLVESQELQLYQTLNSVKGRVLELLERGEFSAALQALTELREPIDALFDNVMVMAKERELRQNRLALLSHIAQLAFINFTQIQTDN